MLEWVVAEMAAQAIRILAVIHAYDIPVLYIIVAVGAGAVEMADGRLADMAGCTLADALMVISLLFPCGRVAVT